MATQPFRSAFHGFNRQDVVRYIEYLNNQHKSQIEQLNNQLQNAPAVSKLQAELDAALAKCAQLEAKLAEAPASMAAATEQELAAYRRAERAERAAQERAQQIRTQANAILADAAVKAEDAAARISQLADQANAQLQAYQETITGTQSLFRDTVAALSAIKAENE